MTKVLFVCLGNICRSPTAEGLFKHHVDKQGLNHKVLSDSAGTSGWHHNEPPDSRSQTAAKDYGIDLSNIRSRQVSVKDFSTFNYIIAMDQQNLEDLNRLCPEVNNCQLSLLLNFIPEFSRNEVPDPYYHGSFNEVFKMIDLGTKKLLDHIKDKKNYK